MKNLFTPEQFSILEQNKYTKLLFLLWSSIFLTLVAKKYH